DLLGGEAAEGSEGERDLRLERESRVTAREEQLQALVWDGRLEIHLLLSRVRHAQEPSLLLERLVAPDPVDRPVPGGGQEPGARVARCPLAGPALGGGREGLLSGLLGEVEAAEEADQVGEDASPLFAEDLVEDRYPSATGRISIAPPIRAAGILEASSIAASRSSASKVSQPARASFTETKGPSVVSVLSSSTRTVVA